MLSARLVIVVAVLVAVVSLIVASVGFLQSIDNGGLGLDSHGVRAYGQRGLFETFERLGIRVRRMMANPEPALKTNGTIAYLGPLPSMIENEPGYLERVAAWVRQGGRVVFAPRRPRSSERWSRQQAKRLGREKEVSVWEILGVPKLELELVNLGPPSDSDSAAPTVSKATAFEESTDDLGMERFQAVLRRRAPPTTNIRLEGTGDLQEVATRAPTIVGPREALQTLVGGKEEASGALFFRGPRTKSIADEDKQGKEVEGAENGVAETEEFRVAARFPVGKGEVIVVSDPKLAQNWFLANGDNGVFWHGLMVRPGEPVIFDEFYHGLTIRGNPLWLAARFPYSLLIFSLLFACAVWIWRDVRTLGPPLPLVESSRRSLSEYVDAMARFLLRGRKTNHFVLEEIRDGVLWKVRGELGMSHAHGSVAEIAAALAKKDPKRAARFSRGIEGMDVLLAGKRLPNEEETVTAIQRISECL